MTDLNASQDSGDSERKVGQEVETDNDSGSCFRDTKQTWLEKRWEAHKSSTLLKKTGTVSSGLSPVGNRLCINKGRQRSSIVHHQPNISAISLTDFVQTTNSPHDCYSVTLHGPHGLGISVFVSFDGMVTVEGLHTLRNGTRSPGQNCEVIRIGDQLMQVNGIRLDALSFYATTELLKDLDKLAKVRCFFTAFACFFFFCPRKVYFIACNCYVVRIYSVTG